jgi:hypothetical protein
VLFIQIKSLFGKWKLPIEYHACKGSMNAENLQKIILNAIDTCFNAGLKVKIVVCDQGTPNQKLYKLLQTTVDKPFFLYSNITPIFLI